MRAIELETCGWRIGSARSTHGPAEVIVCASNASLCMKQTLALRILDPSESAVAKEGNGGRECGLSLAICREGSVLYIQISSEYMVFNEHHTLFLMLQIGNSNLQRFRNVSDMRSSDHPCHGDTDRSMTPPSSLVS